MTLFDLAGSRKELDELNKRIHSEDFWMDKESGEVQKRARSIENKLNNYSDLSEKLGSLSELVELAEEDEEMLSEACKELDEVSEKINKLHVSSLLRGKYDGNNAILTLHAGAGGTEAQDWVEMLYRMYTRYGERNGYKVNELDLLAGDDAGIKSVTFSVSGANAYGYLKAEKGVHRLVRISPFDANKRRHTSFASLEVMPEIEDDTDIVIDEKDLKVDTYRSSGAGGQHVNKTESAVRITHIPTGIIVACQNERSQVQNRARAMAMLKGKLIEMREREQLEEAASLKGELKKIEWGSQIRSYVFCPYTLVKDHRTGYENANITDVMDGNIQGFIEDYLTKAYTK